MATEYTKPYPGPQSGVDPTLLGGARRHELVMPRCTICAPSLFLSQVRVPTVFIHAPGVGESQRSRQVHSFTIVQQTGKCRFQNDVPYVYAGGAAR